MLNGYVNSEYEPIVPFELHGSEGRVARIEAAIDTGYNGLLTLPSHLIDEVGLSFVGTARASLGDGNEVRMDLFLAVVPWEDGMRDVLVLEAEGGVLAGMAMLIGCRVAMDVETGGAVSIESLEKIRAKTG